MSASVAVVRDQCRTADDVTDEYEIKRTAKREKGRQKN